MPVGIAMETRTAADVLAGKQAPYWVIEGPCLLPILVSPTNTPGVAVQRGDLLQVDVGADGVSTSPPADLASTVLHQCLGRAWDPGAAGDLIGVIPNRFAYTAAT
jgi:hypothetical protein